MALKSSYFISIDAAMDPNLLRFPEVVLEKLEVKMEDEETDGEDFLVESEMHTFPADDFPDPAETEDRPVTIKDETLPCHASNEEAPVEPGGGSGSPECQGRRTGGEHYVVGADECRERTRGQRKGKGHRETSSIHGRPGMSEERGRLRGTHISMQDWSARLRTSRRRSRGRGARRQHWVQRQREGQGDRGGACVDEERLRGHRFTEEENEALVEGVLRRYEDLCGHSSVRGSSLRKRCFWQEIVNEVNSRGTIFRTVEVCKKRFADCRRVVKAKMAALEQQALGNGDLHEEIRFNTWEELLRHKITMVAGHGIDGMVDVCETSSFHSTVHWNSLAPPPPAETPSMGPAWTGIIDTAVPELEPAPLSDSDEATSPLNHLLGEWPEDDPPSPCIKSEVLGSLYDTPTLPFTSHTTSWTVNSPPEIPDGREYLRIQEDYNKRLRQLNRSRNIELHKLRGNVLQGSSSIAGHLEGLTREVRELNSHVRHMHMNQTHFNLMFQNYLSDTRQFYGSMVQALQNLHQAPTVSPMASPASSPATSPKPRVVTPPPASPLMTTSSSSQSACAEAASASSTASEAMVCSNRKHGPKATAKTQPPRKC